MRDLNPKRKTSLPDGIAAVALSLSFVFVGGGLLGVPAYGDIDVDAAAMEADGTVFEHPSAPAPELSADSGGTSADAQSWTALDSGGDPVEGGTYYYTGKSVSPITSLKIGDATVGEGDAYMIKYLNNVSAPDGSLVKDGEASSTASAMLVGIGEYSGKIDGSVKFSIRKRDLGNPSDVEVGEIKAQKVGAEPKPVLKTKTGGAELHEGTDYMLSYTGNDRAGETASVIVTAVPGAKSICMGSVSVPFKVLANEDKAELIVDPVATQSWAGKAVEPSPTVRYKPANGGEGRQLSAGKDYSISYKDNTAPGTATLTVTGLGDYAGLSAQASFQIADANGVGGSGDASSIAAAEVSMPSGGIVYTGKAISVKPDSVRCAGKTLVEGKDYSLDYENNVNAGTAVLVIQGKGEFSGVRKETFTIGKADISKANGGASSQSYAAGQALKPSVSLTFNGSKLGTDSFRITSYENNVNPGQGRAIVNGIGNFEGQKIVSFTIGKRKLSETKVSHPLPRYADGFTPVKPSLTVSLDGKKLVKDKDYTVKYSNNKKPGKAKATIKAKPNSGYTGSTTVSFDLVNGGDDTAAVACRLSYSKPKGDDSGTKLYRKRGGSRDCGVGMHVVYKAAKHCSGVWANSSKYGVDEHYRDHSKLVCRFNPDKSPESQGMLPGDLLVNEESGFHTLTYVGKEIPKKIYKGFLKGEDGDIGAPLKGSNFVSAHHFFDGGAGVCICTKKWGLASSHCLVYRLVPDDKSRRAGKVVKPSKLALLKNKKGKVWNAAEINKLVSAAKKADSGK